MFLKINTTCFQRDVKFVRGGEMKAEGRTTAGDERNSSAGIAKSTYSSRTESKREGERERECVNPINQLLLCNKGSQKMKASFRWSFELMLAMNVREGLHPVRKKV